MTNFFGMQEMENALMRLVEYTDEPFYIESVEWTNRRTHRPEKRYHLAHKEDGLITSSLRPDKLAKAIDTFLMAIRWERGREIQRRIEANDD